MFRAIIIFSLLAIFSSAVWAVDGLITMKSKHDVATTLDRLESKLKEKGVIVMARVDHQKNAKGVSIDLRPTQLLIFGNPKLGSNFFTSQQTAAIDLPMKAIAWEDETGQVWLGYNDPAYIASRHGIADRAEVVKKMTGALAKFSAYATDASKP